MKILLTRPFEDSLYLSNKLDVLDIKNHIEPVVTILYKDNLTFTEDFFTVVVTSRHAVRSLFLSQLPLHIPIIAITEPTAEIAIKLGFQKVLKVDGPSKTLVEYIQQKIPREQHILYAHGNHIKHDLHHILENLGYKVHNLITYHVQPHTYFSADTIRELQQNRITHCAVFSERTVNYFLDLMEHHHLLYLIPKLKAIAYTEEIAQILYQQPWKKVHILPKPHINYFLQFCESQPIV